MINGSRTADTGVKIATLKALYEILRKSKASISESSVNQLLNLIKANDNEEDGMNMTPILKHNADSPRRRISVRSQTAECDVESASVFANRTYIKVCGKSVYKDIKKYQD